MGLKAMNKNRKLEIKPEYKWLIKPEAVAEVEAKIAAVPDEAWKEWAWLTPFEQNRLDVMFSWRLAPEGDGFWRLIDRCFTVLPLDPEAAKQSEIAEIDRQIAELERKRGELLR